MALKRWAATITLESGVMFSRQLGIKDLREVYVCNKNIGPKIGLKPLEHWAYEAVIKNVIEDLDITIDAISEIKIKRLGVENGDLNNAYYT